MASFDGFSVRAKGGTTSSRVVKMASFFGLVELARQTFLAE